MNCFQCFTVTNTDTLNKLEYISLNTSAGISLGLIPKLKMCRKLHKFIIFNRYYQIAVCSNCTISGLPKLFPIITVKVYKLEKIWSLIKDCLWPKGISLLVLTDQDLSCRHRSEVSISQHPGWKILWQHVCQRCMMASST